MKNLFITGVTGFLGGELLVELSKKQDVEKIFCLIRAQSFENGLIRLKKIFDLHGDYFDTQKVIPIIEELTDAELSLKLINNPALAEIDTIIHSAANTSFSKIYDNIVEKVNIEGTQHLLEWAKTLKNLNLFTYVGTATICGKTVKDCIVSEDMSPNTDAKHLVKYTYTKMVGELMLKKYLPSEKILVVRPSIIMGDSRKWKPRSYVILWALATLNELRLFPGNSDSNVDIISIDYAARSIIELVLNENRKYSVYHISSGKVSSTTPGKVTGAIADFFPGKPDFKFVSRSLMADMKKWSKNTVLINEQSNLFTYRSYLDYWLNMYDDNSKLRILFYALEPYIDFIELGQIFDNSRLLEDTTIGQSIPAHEYLKITGETIKEINIFEGAVDY
ncbi:MAG: SDR family oxidoreductase [Bacteroidales bacterium]|nr:SDR family oxidoreductase [Bacteroidales bacterium]